MDKLEKAFKSPRKAFKAMFFALLCLLSIFLLISINLNKTEKSVEKISIFNELYKVEEKERNKTEKILNNLEFSPLYINEVSKTLDKMEFDANSLIPQIAEMNYQGDSALGASLGSGLMDFEEASLQIFEVLDLDQLPRRLKNASIRYPKKMLQKGIEGEVRLLVLIDENGNLILEKVLSATNADFEKEAILALKEFKYEVPLKMGKAVRARFILPIPFKIEEIK
ncbi:MAG: energy transducer TonB [Opitutales bacterium]